VDASADTPSLPHLNIVENFPAWASSVVPISGGHTAEQAVPQMFFASFAKAHRQLATACGRLREAVEAPEFATARKLAISASVMFAQLGRLLRFWSQQAVHCGLMPSLATAAGGEAEGAGVATTAAGEVRGFAGVFFDVFVGATALATSKFEERIAKEMRRNVRRVVARILARGGVSTH